MFSPVNNVDTLVVCAEKLLKQRKKHQQTLLYNVMRINQIEQQLMAYVYALSHIDNNQLDSLLSDNAELGGYVLLFKQWQQCTSQPFYTLYKHYILQVQSSELVSISSSSISVAVLTDSFAIMANHTQVEQGFVLPKLLDSFLYSSVKDNDQNNARNSAKDRANEVLVNPTDSTKSITAETPQSEIPAVVKPAPIDSYAPLSQLKLPWLLSGLKTLRQTALANKFTPSLPLSCLLMGQEDVSANELTQAYQQPNNELAIAAFIKGFAATKESATNSTNATNVTNALFHRFAQCDDELTKVSLLQLAGLSANLDWIEPCKTFCLTYPQHTFMVLSYFQHKGYLPLIIQLLAQAATAQGAYQAWLLLTNQPLPLMPQLQDTANKFSHSNQQQIAQSALSTTKKQGYANTDKAEWYRQQFMLPAQQAQGDCLLHGRSFNCANASTILADLRGKAVQGALLFGSDLSQGMALWHSELTQAQYQAWSILPMSTAQTAHTATAEVSHAL